MKIAILGGGMVGSLIAKDLAKDHQVTVLDVSAENLAKLDGIENLSTQQQDLRDYNAYPQLLKDFEIVVTAVPGFMGYQTLEAVINCGKDVADISFFPEDALALDALAKQKNVTVITDCGVAPGMSNLILGYENARQKVESFECLVGGLPKVRVMPFEYKAPFSPIDVIEEYTRPARYVENGHIVTKPALSDTEFVDMRAAGTLESFNTDGLRSILFTMKHIPNMKEKTLRYPGHVSLMRSLISAGFLSEHERQVKGRSIRPIDLTSAILFDAWKLEPSEPEFTVMRIRIGTTDRTIEYFLYDETDAQGNSSMSRTTGYACTAMVKLLAQKQCTEKGVFPPELIGGVGKCFETVMTHLRERNVNYQVSEI